MTRALSKTWLKTWGSKTENCTCSSGSLQMLYTTLPRLLSRYMISHVASYRYCSAVLKKVWATKRKKYRCIFKFLWSKLLRYRRAFYTRCKQWKMSWENSKWYRIDWIELVIQISFPKNWTKVYSQINKLFNFCKVKQIKSIFWLYDFGITEAIPSLPSTKWLIHKRSSNPRAPATFWK